MTSLVPFSPLLGHATNDAHFKKIQVFTKGFEKLELSGVNDFEIRRAWWLSILEFLKVSRVRFKCSCCLW